MFSSSLIFSLIILLLINKSIYHHAYAIVLDERQHEYVPCCQLNVSINENVEILKIDAKRNKDTRKVVFDFVSKHSLISYYEQLYAMFEQRRMEHEDSINDKTFFFQDNDGQGLSVINYLEKVNNYRRVYLQYLPNIYFKWVTWPRQIDWGLFQEGKHIVNGIENIFELDRKDYMQYNMFSYWRNDQICNQSNNICLNPSTFFPETFDISTKDGCEKWLSRIPDIDEKESDDQLWLIKPPNEFAGKGQILLKLEQHETNVAKRTNICDFYIKSSRLLQKTTRSDNDVQYDIHGLQHDNSTWIQRYISKPGLSLGKKFSIRTYVLILSVNPPIVLHHDGLVYRSLVDYKPYANSYNWSTMINTKNEYFSNARLAHITNIQSHHPDWQNRKHDGLISFESLAETVNKDDNEESISKSCNIHETSLKNMFLFFGDGKAAKLNDVEEEDTKLFFPGCLHLKDKLDKLTFDTKLDENTLVAAELAIEIGTRMCENEK